MAILLHSTILATVIGATAAVAYGGATLFSDRQETAAKGDRLAIEARCDLAAADPMICKPEAGLRYVTVEERSEGLSVLTRIPVDADR